MKKEIKKALSSLKMHVPKPIDKIEVTIKKKIFGHAPEEHHFILQDGRRLKNMYELIAALEDMSEDVFRYHANEAKNDFSNWVNDIFDEKNLAREIAGTKTKIEAQIKIMKHLVDELRK